MPEACFQTRIVLLAGILSLLWVLSCSAGPPSASGQPSVSIEGRTFSVELARTEAEHVIGLSGHPPLGDTQGMLFISDDDEPQSFWMRGMLFPLDIVFIDSKGRIVDIKRDFKPCSQSSCPAYASARPAKYVLEVNPGLVGKDAVGKEALISGVG